MLEKSLRAYGAGRSILLDKHGRIIAGNKTVQVAAEIGLDDLVIVETDGSQMVAVKRNDLDLETDDDARALAYADNRVAEVDLDFDPLQLVMDRDAGKLPDFWTDDEIAELISADAEQLDPADDPGPDIDDANELQEKWQVETGQIWEIGEHRLMCGDATNRNDVVLLAGGVKSFDVCQTDLPYGLGDSVTEKNDYESYEDTKENLKEIIKNTFPILEGYTKVIVLTPGNLNQSLYKKPTWTMAWFVPAGTGRGPWGFICWQPILCYGTDPKLAKGKGSHPDAIVHTETSEKLGHPCNKPINFWIWVMERISEQGETVLDPFLGSGTTMVAAQQLDRKCFGMEIEPKYCAVVLERMQGMGLTPRLEGAAIQCGV